MSEAIKVLMDDHKRVRDLFKQFAGGNTNVDLAARICDELTIHSLLEEEIVYPVLRRDVDADLAAEAEREHAEAKQMIAQIREMDPGDPELPMLMTRLERAVEHHVQEEENEAFPQLEEQTEEDLYAMGNEMFRRRQELLQDLQVGALR